MISEAAHDCDRSHLSLQHPKVNQLILDCRDWTDIHPVRLERFLKADPFLTCLFFSQKMNTINRILRLARDTIHENGLLTETFLFHVLDDLKDLEMSVINDPKAKPLPRSFLRELVQKSALLALKNLPLAGLQQVLPHLPGVSPRTLTVGNFFGKISHELDRYLGLVASHSLLPLMLCKNFYPILNEAVRIADL